MNTPLHILSFDIEEWFLGRDASIIPVAKWPLLPARVVDSTHIILQLLRKHQQKAVFYVLGWIAEQYPELVQLIASEGHTIGYHSYYHQLPQQQGPIAFEEDLVRGLSLLEKITAQKIIHYRAPLFSLHNNLWIIPILLRHGITVSSSSKSGESLLGSQVPHQPFYFEIENQKLLELPLNRLKLLGQNFVYSGSGYMRILPAAMVQYFYKRKKYTLTYFHPRDFDTAVPRAKELGFSRNFMNRLGNKSTFNKFEYLLRNFVFLPPAQIPSFVNKLFENDKIPRFFPEERR